MLRTATWMVRAAGFVVGGAFTFTANQGRGTQLGMEIAAFTLTGLVVAAWAVSDRSARARAHWARWLPVALGVIAIACASGSATARGGPLIALALMATLSAGSDISITAGWTVLGAGVLAMLLGGTLRAGADSGRWVVTARVIARGKTNPDIAVTLFLSSHTVKSHINRIFSKTGAVDRSGAVLYAKDHDLV